MSGRIQIASLTDNPIASLISSQPFANSDCFVFNFLFWSLELKIKQRERPIYTALDGQNTDVH